MSSDSLSYVLFRKSYVAIKFLYTKISFIIILCLLGSLIGIGFAISQSAKYTGTVSFVLSSESKSSNLSGLASQFGIDIASGSGSDLFSGDNIISLLYSKKMIKRVLFKTPPESNDLLVNLVARDLHFDAVWNRKERFKNLFPFPQNGSLNKIQDSLVNEIFLKIKSDLLDVSRPDRMINVYTVTAHSHNELFSCYLPRFLVDETATFYIETKTRIARQNLSMLQKEADSLKSLLGSSISITASEVDRTFNLNPALQIKKSSAQKQQINSSVLTAAYGEVIKNLELAKINLQKETPLYQVLDVPELPLKSYRISKLLASLVGFILVFIFVIPSLLIVEKINFYKRNLPFQ